VPQTPNPQSTIPIKYNFKIIKFYYLLFEK
jgi:hypothetical protein